MTTDERVICEHCSRNGRPDIDVIEIGVPPRWWLHPACWQPWYMARKAARQAAASAGEAVPADQQLSDADIGRTQGKLAVREKRA